MTDHRASWLAALAKLTTPHDAERAAAAMSAYMPFLVDLPEAAFTLASMRHVAMAPRRMMIPDLREVLDPLEAWWREHGPRRVALPPPAKPAAEEYRVSPEERAAVAAQMRALVESLKPAEPERPKVRSHVIPAEVLAEARARLMAGGKR